MSDNGQKVLELIHDIECELSLASSYVSSAEDSLETLRELVKATEGFDELSDEDMVAVEFINQRGEKVIGGAIVRAIADHD